MVFLGFSLSRNMSLPTDHLMDGWWGSGAQPRTSSSDTMARFNEEAGSGFIRRQKVINHPGEVNKLREFPHRRNVIVTHTDAAEVRIVYLQIKRRVYSRLLTRMHSQ